MRALVAVCLAVFFLGPARSQEGPTKIMVGFSAGGVSDVLARVYAEEFKRAFGRTVVVENRPGGSGMVAASMVSRADPDGSTLIMISGGYTIIPALQKLDFDPKTALTPVNLIASAPNLLVVRSDSGYRDVNSLVEDAKRNPGALAYGSSGIGATVHLMALMLEQESGIKLNHIPYKSSAESVQAVIGGHIPMSFSALNSALPALQSGQVRAIAIASEARSSILSDVPTFAEAGYPAIQSDTWIGLAGPAGMNERAVEALNAAVVASLGTSEMKKRISDLGAEPVGKGPAKFQEVIVTEIDKFERLARQAGLPRN